MVLVRKSEYLTGLTGDARARYESKVSSLGLISISNTIMYNMKSLSSALVVKT